MHVLSGGLKTCHGLSLARRYFRFRDLHAADLSVSLTRQHGNIPSTARTYVGCEACDLVLTTQMRCNRIAFCLDVEAASGMACFSKSRCR